MVSSKSRLAKGVSFGGLVKLLRAHRKKRPFRECSLRAAELLEERVLPTEWYPHADLLELLGAHRPGDFLRGNERMTEQFGIAGGTEALTLTYHKAFVRPGDPAASLVAMQHTWRLYFDFGALSATLEPRGGVLFVLDGYPDMPPYHGTMIVGWHVAAGIVSGASTAAAEILEAPWRAGSRLAYRVTF